MATSGSKQPREPGDTPSRTKRANTNTSTELRQQRLDGYVSPRAEPAPPPSHSSDSDGSSVESAPTNDETPTTPVDPEQVLDAALNEFDQLDGSNPTSNAAPPTLPPASLPTASPVTNDNPPVPSSPTPSDALSSDEDSSEASGAPSPPPPPPAAIRNTRTFRRAQEERQQRRTIHNPYRRTTRVTPASRGRGGRGTSLPQTNPMPLNPRAEALQPPTVPTDTSRHQTRVTLVFRVTEAETTDDGLHNLVTDFLTELQAIDPQAALLPWWPDS